MPGLHNLAIFIHGVTPEPMPTETIASRLYAKLEANVSELNNHRYPWQAKAYFHWGMIEGEGSDLALAELEVFERLKSSNPLEDYILFAITDLLYAVSSSGRDALQKRLLERIFEELEVARGKNKALALAFIAHSAGCVVITDLLLATRHSRAKDMIKLRELIDDGEVQIRKVFTMGSPVGAFMPRYPAAARALRRRKRVALSHFGWRPEYGQRWWLNFWRDGDPAAHRVGPLLEDNGAVDDIKVSGRDVNSVGEFIDVHGAYFKMKTVARHIVESFRLDPF